MGVVKRVVPRLRTMLFGDAKKTPERLVAEVKGL